jgi:hypothetical protein
MSTASISAGSVDVLKIFQETVNSLSIFDKCALVNTDAKSLLSDVDRDYLSHATSMMRPNEQEMVKKEVSNPFSECLVSHYVVRLGCKY